MKFEKLKTLCVLAAFLFLAFQNGYSQTTESNESAVASVSLKHKNDFVVYSFEPLTEFDEFKTSQRVGRINGMTGDNASVEFKNNKIFITVNPDLTNGENLDKLLNLIVRIHGYSSFVIS